MIESAKQSIGDRLRIFREFKKLTQSQFASAMEMSTTGLQSNESNRSLPNSKLLVALYHQGLNVNWLLSGEGQMLLSNSLAETEQGDVKLYADAMEAIDYLLQEGKKVATYQQRRALVDALYQASKQTGEIDKTTAIMIAKLAA
ncbi:helix-turn-helix domain-containing protein [Undibacterium sp. TC9W]|uniref:helix-turn-helix domain-containing protein n=1 Tax=Undibacterium sp. TC9W TaxID=3413053 RepID=UPI003BF28C63